MGSDKVLTEEQKVLVAEFEIRRRDWVLAETLSWAAWIIIFMPLVLAHDKELKLVLFFALAITVLPAVFWLLPRLFGQNYWALKCSFCNRNLTCNVTRTDPMREMLLPILNFCQFCGTHIGSEFDLVCVGLRRNARWIVQFIYFGLIIASVFIFTQIPARVGTYAMAIGLLVAALAFTALGAALFWRHGRCKKCKRHGLHRDWAFCPDCGVNKQ